MNSELFGSLACLECNNIIYFLGPSQGFNDLRYFIQQLVLDTFFLNADDFRIRIMIKQDEIK